MPSLTQRVLDLATEVGSWLKKVRTSDIVFVIGDNVNDLSTKIYGDFRVNSAYTITGWTLLSRQGSASVIVEISKGTYANWPTVSAITGTAKPTLSGVQKATSTTLTGWTTALTAGDVLTISVSSFAAGTKQVSLILHVRKV